MKSATLRRHSRAAVFWALAVLVVGQLVLRYGIDHFWPALRDPSFEIKASRFEQVIAESPQKPVTVMMVGSSVSRNLFKAQYLEDELARELGQPAVVMNMSCLGAGPLTELVWTRRLIDRGIRPDVVCIEVTPFQFNKQGAPVDAPRFPDHILDRKST